MIITSVVLLAINNGITFNICGYSNNNFLKSSLIFLLFIKLFNIYISVFIFSAFLYTFSKSV